MGAKYIGYNNETLAHELGSTRDLDIFVFSFTEAAWRGSENWAKIISILHQLLHEEGASSRILIRDCDATGETLDRPKIVLYRNAEMLNENILEQLGKPRARYRHEKRDRPAHKPVSRIPVSIPCPGQHCTLGCKHDWICSRCSSRIEYGRVDDYLYCDCGRCHYRYWDFRCPDPKHGPDFTRFEGQALHTLLEGLEAIKQCNILILGRTGVGKSTWINSLVNYLTYSTLDSALEADSLTGVIPFAFTTYMTKSDGEYESIKVQSGFDSQSVDIPAIHRGNVDEHDGSTGQSATQRTNEHCIQMDDCEIRLIDTPGIGDTRGASRDKENMADILSFLQSYPKLHGILILLKPNDQKLDLMFKFCMQELLTHLHRDAAKNIAFGFTNTRGTNYQPGDSFGALNQLLSKFSDVDIALRRHNVYCFDSESFRHLAARKLHGQLLGSPEENSRSWQHSVEESKRLIKYFMDLEPHYVTSSINLYATRNCIVKLTEPMASIAQAIRGSMNLAEYEMRSLEQCKADRKKLEQHRKRKTVSISASPLDKPKTTCCHDDCVSHVGTGSKGSDEKEVLKTVYKSTCHSPCGLNGVKVDIIGNANLRGCAAMNSMGKCTVCGHDWQLHLHVKYDQVERTVETDDPTIISQLDANASFADTKRTLLEAKQTYIRELEEELHIVTSTAAQFSNFLKRNAIMPYNDATLDYLDRSIQDEKENVALGGSRDQLDRLEQYRKQYEQQVKVLDEHIAKGENSKLLDQAVVEESVKKLHGLPHYGRNLKDIGMVVDRIQYPEPRERRRVFRPKPHDSKETQKRKDPQEVVASRGSRWAPERVWKSVTSNLLWRWP
ncbi:hypothetical protein BJX65DRAFT_313944 [Aspergillus insuetus]